MSSFEVRPFRRDDREQLAALINGHAAAVVPGVSVSVNAVMSQLERDPGEFIVDPWVDERVTLVAEQRQRIVAAAHLLRYGGGDQVGESYRNSAEIRWFLFWPAAPFWPDSPEPAESLMAACVAQLDRWAAPRQYADGSLPAPGVYGVPEQWPHVRAAYERAGFEHQGRVEVIFMARVDELPRGARAPLDGLALRRSVGINGTRLSALLGEEVLGFVEVEAVEDHGRLARHSGLADIGNLDVVEAYSGHDVETWLVAQAADWLRLARVERVLDYATPDEGERIALLTAAGFRELTRTERGWVRTPP
jgi:ribosomal protein S18 acetylase RimI-like enzyme